MGICERLKSYPNMSRLGIKVALQFGKGLPSFENIAQAREFFFSLRDELLAKLAEISQKEGFNFTCDFTPESLRELEIKYFELVETDSFGTLSLEREEFEACMAAYFLAVAVKNSPAAEWIVSEFAFGKGKYEWGVRKGLLTVMVPNFKDYYRTQNNNRKQGLFRFYKRYFS